MIQHKCLAACVSFVFAIVFVTMAQSSQMPGTWKNVTDSRWDMGGFWARTGPVTVLADPVRPGEVYVNTGSNGTWKSTDFGITYTQVSTGLNGDLMTKGTATSAIIDLNPNRNPATPPTMMVNSFGYEGFWKTTNGGVDWVNVWNNNIYKPDGVTNISSDVGGDCGGLMLISHSNLNHVISWLHSYYGTGGNDGIFETKDGGVNWILHPTPNFNFQPHADNLSALDSVTWFVDHGYPAELWRTTDAGVNWVQSTGDIAGGIGIAGLVQAGNTIYSGSDYHDGLFKTTDRGITWHKVPTPAGPVSWVAVTATNIYTGCGLYNDSNTKVQYASLSNDQSWTVVAYGATVNGAFPPAVMFDGIHYIILVPNEASGLWRYVEPAAGTRIEQKAASRSVSSSAACSRPAIALVGTGHARMVVSSGRSAEVLYDIKGRILPRAR